MANFHASMTDQIAARMAPAYRLFRDQRIKLVGQKTNVLRITRYSKRPWGSRHFDIHGYSEGQLVSTMLTNVVIHYPFGKVEIFARRSGTQASTKALDFIDALPLELELPFKDARPGDFAVESASVVEGDRIVDVIFDEYKNKLPIILVVTKMNAGLTGKHMIAKTGLMALWRGPLEQDIQDAVDSYITGLVV